MLKSHVVKGFWLGLPRSFCRNHLPDHDVTITLEDEEGNIYATNYLAKRTGLSGGWNGFAVVNELNVGDAVVFQLVTLTRFKVYIVRETKFTKTDGALGLDTSLGSNTPEEESSNEDVNSEEDPEATRFSCNAFGNGRHNKLDSEEADDDGLRSPDPDTDFSAVKSFRDFNIVLDGLDIEPKLFPDRLRRMYYQLCCARKAFLHRHLLKHISPGLAAGLIVETANIAEGIRASHASSSSHEDLSAWKTILQSLELAGMDVAFLRKRVDDLHVAAEEKLERDHAEEKMRALTLKMSSLNDALKDLCMEAEEMVEWIAKQKRKEEQAMRELATAPW
uniref:Uncharacterized protein n=1 Tax=Avena sativa TaxID=4498 RepID=A0ACD5UME8_AVESA